MEMEGPEKKLATLRFFWRGDYALVNENLHTKLACYPVEQTSMEKIERTVKQVIEEFFTML